MASPSPAIDLPTQIQNYEVRDTLVGRNYVEQDVKRALELASACHHPDAQWLTEIFAGKDVNTPEEAREVFLAHENDDARALGFAALVALPRDDALLSRAAEMGFEFAQAQFAGQGTDEERFTLSLRASLQRERDGIFFLGRCYENGVGCEQDVTKVKQNYLLAAKLNHVDAMVRCGYLLDDSDPQRWWWWGLAAAKGSWHSFFDHFAFVVDRFNSDLSLRPAVFAIGRALKEHINEEKKEIFGFTIGFDARIVPANQAVAFFSFQCSAARAALDTWCLMARRELSHQVNRDIRKKIGMLIWEARELAEYKESSGIEKTS